VLQEAVAEAAAEVAEGAAAEAMEALQQSLDTF